MLSSHIPVGASLAELAPLSGAGWGEHRGVPLIARVQGGVYTELGLAAEGWMICSEVTLSKILLEQIWMNLVSVCILPVFG